VTACAYHCSYPPVPLCPAHKFHLSTDTSTLSVEPRPTKVVLANAAVGMPWLERLFLRESRGTLVQKTPVVVLENMKAFPKMVVSVLKKQFILFIELHLSL